ncbi:hypothetical protein NUG13_12380 [Bacillus subtilis]|uniref:hypothetical protein n=1 Tax=Bacillus subtilis group TaxID=653685 RepID=UPI00200E6A13|nr:MULTISPECIES: hypothetical protein [Bacillus subtilis group]MCR4362127.1 hypothetical protein [Bacillus subtilis]UQB84269.1 hypothetical protein KMZ31_20360 [Bacillus amyloliquefaciens]
MTRRGFYHLSESIYAEVNLKNTEYIDEVNFGMFDGDGGTDGEMSLYWYRSGNRSWVKLEVFDDSFKVLNQFTDVIRALENRENIQPKEFTKLLKELGFVDLTKRGQIILERRNYMDFKQKLNEIINNNTLTNGEKHNELKFLLSDMAVEYNIPLEYGQEYREKNKEVIEVFEEISKEIWSMMNK